MIINLINSKTVEQAIKNKVVFSSNNCGNFIVVGYTNNKNVTIKFIDNLKRLIEEMKKPVIATVLATYPMSIMLLSSFFKKVIFSEIFYWQQITNMLI